MGILYLQRRKNVTSEYNELIKWYELIKALPLAPWDLSGQDILYLLMHDPRIDIYLCVNAKIMQFEWLIFKFS